MKGYGCDAFKLLFSYVPCDVGGQSTIGLCIGMSLGIAYGSIADNMTAGLTYGPCFGLLLGTFLMNIKKK